MGYFFRQFFHFGKAESWDESQVKRGKTTPESNSGSFAPRGQSGAVEEKKPAAADPNVYPEGHVLAGYHTSTVMDEHGVIITSNIDDAVKALIEGREVDLFQPREVSMMLERLADIAKESFAKGEDAGKYNLCRVTMAGTNLFCHENIGLTRVQMPQLIAKPEPGSTAASWPVIMGKDGKPDSEGQVDAGPHFEEDLRDQGVTITPDEEGAAYLKATQNELDGRKVAGIMRAMKKGSAFGYFPPLLISKDNYIIDGHHRWAALVGLDSEDGHLGDVKLAVHRVDMTIIPLIQRANEYCDEVGMPRAAHGKFVKGCSAATCGV